MKPMHKTVTPEVAQEIYEQAAIITRCLDGLYRKQEGLREEMSEVRGKIEKNEAHLRDLFADAVKGQERLALKDARRDGEGGSDGD